MTTPPPGRAPAPGSVPLPQEEIDGAGIEAACRAFHGEDWPGGASKSANDIWRAGMRAAIAAYLAVRPAPPTSQADGAERTAALRQALREIVSSTSAVVGDEFAVEARDAAHRIALRAIHPEQPAERIIPALADDQAPEGVDPAVYAEFMRQCRSAGRKARASLIAAIEREGGSAFEDEYRACGTDWRDVIGGASPSDPRSEAAG